MKHVAAILLIGAFAFATGCKRDRSVSAPSAAPAASPAAAQPTATPGDPNFPGWPSTWIETYKRFQAYIAARQTSWPESGLHYSLDGTVSYTLRSGRTTTGHLTLSISRRGRRIFERLLPESTTDNLIAEGRDYLFQAPGPYATYIKSCGPLGYQTHFPIVWIETHQAADPAGPTLQIRATKAPGPSDSVWPNEQSQLFKDFHVFPGINPNDIYDANGKVSPAAQLRVTHKGVIKRETLFEPAVEKLLHWRVYHEGHLIEKGPAGAMKTFDPKRGVGSYSAWIGVEGPNGFMPVSNLLEYPLFPTDTGENVIPTVERGKAVIAGPLERALNAEDERARLVHEDRERSKGGLKDRSSPTLRPPETDQEKTNRELLELWGSWAFTLEHPQITAIPFAPD